MEWSVSQPSLGNPASFLEETTVNFFLFSLLRKPMHLQTQYLCFTNIHIFLFLIEMVVSTYTFASCFFPLTIWESGVCNHKQNCLVLFVGCIVFHMCIGCAIIFKPVLYGRIFKVFTRFCSYKGHYTNDCVCIVLYL